MRVTIGQSLYGPHEDTLGHSQENRTEHSKEFEGSLNLSCLALWLDQEEGSVQLVPGEVKELPVLS